MTQMTQNFNPVIHIQKYSKDDTQWDCSEMVGCVSLRSFEVMLQTQTSKQFISLHNERTSKCKSGVGEGLVIIFK